MAGLRHSGGEASPSKDAARSLPKPPSSPATGNWAALVKTTSNRGAPVASGPSGTGECQEVGEARRRAMQAPPGTSNGHAEHPVNNMPPPLPPPSAPSNPASEMTAHSDLASRCVAPSHPVGPLQPSVPLECMATLPSPVPYPAPHVPCGMGWAPFPPPNPPLIPVPLFLGMTPPPEGYSISPYMQLPVAPLPEIWKVFRDGGGAEEWAEKCGKTERGASATFGEGNEIFCNEAPPSLGSPGASSAPAETPTPPLAKPSGPPLSWAERLSGKAFNRALSQPSAPSEASSDDTEPQRDTTLDETLDAADGTAPALKTASLHVEDGDAHAALKSMCCDLSESLAVKEARLKPRGISNPGNLCFASAVLQALLASETFSFMMRCICRASPLLSSLETPVMHALAEFIFAYDESEAEQASKTASAAVGAKEGPKASPSGKTAAKAAKSPAHAGSRPSEPTAPSLSAILAGAPLSPSMLPALVRNFAPGDGPARSMTSVRQHDAQEFCMYLIDALHQEMEGLVLRRGLQAEAGEGEAEEVLGDEWLTQRRSRAVRQRNVGVAARTPTLAHALFQGVLESSVAASGQPLSITRQTFTVLGLHIANPKVRSLADAMSVLTERELILGYRPSKSKQPVDATKRLNIYSLPPVLVLHLMRFGFGITGTTKIERYIAFEQELEICSSWLSRDSKDRGTTYELFACVTHHGKTVTSGHYTADVLQTDGRWLRYDDASVCRVHSRTVLDGRPYILFYRAKTCK